MFRYILHRFLYSILVLWGVVTVAFVLFNVLPDNRTGLARGTRSESVSTTTAQRVSHLDKPLWVRLGFYLNDLSPIGVTSKVSQAPPGIHLTRLDNDNFLSLKAPYLGRSQVSKRLISYSLWRALPSTLALAGIALLLAIIIGLGLGILAAVKKGTTWDTSAISTYIAGLSMPAFFAAVIIACLSGHLVRPSWLNNTRSLGSPSFILPAIALSIRPMAIIAQVMRSAMLDVLSQDYIRTAYARGFSKARLILRHVLPNALTPVVRRASGWLTELIAGLFFVEYVFGLNGIGGITANGLDALDLPLVMGAVLLTALIFIIVNLFTDVLSVVLDPRERLT